MFCQKDSIKHTLNEYLNTTIQQVGKTLKGKRLKTETKDFRVWLSDDKRTQANTTTIKKFVNPLDEIIEWDEEQNDKT